MYTQLDFIQHRNSELASEVSDNTMNTYAILEIVIVQRIATLQNQLLKQRINFTDTKQSLRYRKCEERDSIA